MTAYQEATGATQIGQISLAVVQSVSPWTTAGSRHPNVQFHFTPTRASWLNQVETWFSILEGKSLNGASFTSVKQLREHIDAFIDRYNQNATPFVWTKAKVRQRPFKGRRLSDL